MIRTSFPRSVSLRENLRLREYAHAGRTTEKPERRSTRSGFFASARSAAPLAHDVR